MVGCAKQSTTIGNGVLDKHYYRPVQRVVDRELSKNKLACNLLHKRKKKMEENKNTKTQETKVEFNLEDEVKASTLVKSFNATARFAVESGRFKSYVLKCATNIAGRVHTRSERLSEKSQQFLIKYLDENLTKNKMADYKATFEVRKNNESKKFFYCWIVAFTENYKLPMLVGKDEKNYLECFVLPKEYINPKDEKVAK